MVDQPRISHERRRRRGVATSVTVVVLFAVLYVGVVALYATSQPRVPLDGCDDDAASGIQMILEPQAVDAVGDRMAATLRIESFGPLDPDHSGVPDTPVTVVVVPNDGPTTFALTEGALPGPLALRLITDGEIESWPFDTHTVDLAVISVAGSGPDARAVPTEICGTVHVPGWSFASEEVSGTDAVVVDGAPADRVRITASRSAATVAFGLVILVLMTALPVLAFTVAILAYLGRRKVEATLTSWMAAMLFATIPLRGFLPGSPPIGSWVDYLVVLWVVVGLVAALALYVAAWVRWAPRGSAAV